MNVTGGSTARNVMAENDKTQTGEANAVKHKYGRINKEYAMQLATCAPEADGPIYMVNLMKYFEVAQYDDSSAPAISGREADDKYNPASVLNKIGASIVFVADVLDDHVGDEDWDRIAIVRYATRLSFIEMQSRKDFGEKHVHKAAGMLRTTLLASRPLDESLDKRDRPQPLELRYLVMVVRQTTDRESVLASIPESVSFTVEGTVLSDGRFWDTVQLIPVATQTAADELAATLSHLAAESSYVMTLRASIDGLTAA